MDRARQILTYALLFLVFGVAVPRWKGLDFLDASLICAYACMGIVFAGPAAAQAFEQRPATITEALRRIGLAVAFGEMISVALLGCGLVTLYVTHSKVLEFPPDLGALVLPEALGLALTLAVASLAAWTAVRFSVPSAKRALRLVFLGLLAAYFLRGQWLPQVTGEAAAISLVIGLIFLGLLTQSMKAPRPA